MRRLNPIDILFIGLYQERLLFQPCILLNRQTSIEAHAVALCIYTSHLFHNLFYYDILL